MSWTCTPGNGVRSRRCMVSRLTSCSRQFSSPPVSWIYSRCRASWAQVNMRMPRSRSSVTTCAAAQSTASSWPGSARSGAIQTFSTPSCGAILGSRLPSGGSLGTIRSGLPNRTVRGMSSVILPAYHTARPTYYGQGVGTVGGTSVSGTRRTTLVGRLVRLGFADPARAAQLLTSDLRLDLDSGERPGAPGVPGAQGRDETVLAAIAGAADPDLALAGLARIAGVERGDDAADLRATLRSEPGFRQRLIAVLGSSVGLADHLARHPGDALLL